MNVVGSARHALPPGSHRRRDLRPLDRGPGQAHGAPGDAGARPTPGRGPRNGTDRRDSRRARSRRTTRATCSSSAACASRSSTRPGTPRARSASSWRTASRPAHPRRPRLRRHALPGKPAGGWTFPAAIRRRCTDSLERTSLGRLPDETLPLPRPPLLVRKAHSTMGDAEALEPVPAGQLARAVPAVHGTSDDTRGQPARSAAA